MSAKVLRILGRHRIIPESVVNLRNFYYFEHGTIDSTSVITNPNFSLYCIDDSSRRAIFVETPSHIDLSAGPFFYQAQFKFARRLIAVPYEELHRLAKSIRHPDGQAVLVYSVGRCGSTLLSKMFNSVSRVLSLPEPDVFTQIVGLRKPDGSRDAELAELLRSCTQILCKPAHKMGVSCWVIKFRSFCIEIADLMYRVFPQAKVIFLYRNAEDVIDSYIRSFLSEGLAGWAFQAMKVSSMARLLLKVFVTSRAEYLSRFVPLIKAFPSRVYTDLGFIGLFAIMWLSTMNRYMLLFRQGIPMRAVRYEDLTADPKQVVTSLFNYCDLPVAEVSHACQVFDRDSQLGSRLAQKPYRRSYLDQGDRLKVRELLRIQPDILTPDCIVPGSLNFKNS
jgi:hypothetical protein